MLIPTLDFQMLHQDLDSAPEENQTLQSFLEKYVFSTDVEPIFVHDSHSIQYGDAEAQTD